MPHPTRTRDRPAQAETPPPEPKGQQHRVSQSIAEASRAKLPEGIGGVVIGRARMARGGAQGGYSQTAKRGLPRPDAPPEALLADAAPPAWSMTGWCVSESYHGFWLELAD
ncbi:hypothetical protein G7Z17_g11379 [Cylindrodendrum hubeiense]|uniref:Uncharacterized protein n=1 Tax=Cylindrodendrum hubeiense TaxID=595255 RepID=A0A9P5L6F4_9HYPO|nr:hypothetical protein G7Z17_g11379 [Cylindrodendrum hubeiense]